MLLVLVAFLSLVMEVLVSSMVVFLMSLIVVLVVVAVGLVVAGGGGGGAVFGDRGAGMLGGCVFVFIGGGVGCYCWACWCC